MARITNPIELLEYHNENSRFTDREYVKAMADDLARTLSSFKVAARVTDCIMTPLSATFTVMLDPGVSVKSVRGLRTDLEVAMASPVEITEDVGIDSTIGIVIKNWNRSPIVGLREILESDEFKNSDYELPIAAGMDVLGRPLIFDLATAPHMLIAGTTGSGKSVFIDDIILSIILNKSEEEVKMVMVDPKYVELSLYDAIPHMLIPVATNANRSNLIFNWVLKEIEDRYDRFAKAGVKNFDDYNVKASDKMYRLVVIIDEFMELMMQDAKQTEMYVREITRKGGMCGINLIMATQRPSSDIISNEMKVNLKCRASFTVVDWRESKCIIDRTGAERLLGNGDMLYSASDAATPVHAQAAYVSDSEVNALMNYYMGERIINNIDNTVAMQKITDEMLAQYNK